MTFLFAINAVAFALLSLSASFSFVAVVAGLIFAALQIGVDYWSLSSMGRSVLSSLSSNVIGGALKYLAFEIVSTLVNVYLTTFACNLSIPFFVVLLFSMLLPFVTAYLRR